VRNTRYFGFIKNNAQTKPGEHDPKNLLFSHSSSLL